jgi:hypothetical protein
VHNTSAHILNLRKTTFKMTATNVSTAVKIVVSMVVVAALVATRFSSKVRRYRRNDVHGSVDRSDWARLDSNGESSLHETVMCFPLFASPC